MSLADLATIACSTKRASISGGKRGTPAANLTGLYCTPLDPVDADLASRAGLNTPLEVLQTFIQGATDTALDIKNGDFLTVNSIDYPIRAAWDYSNWNGIESDSSHWKWLILEEIKS
jgi:hypothetical protein